MVEKDLHVVGMVVSIIHHDARDIFTILLNISHCICDCLCILLDRSVVFVDLFYCFLLV